MARVGMGADRVLRKSFQLAGEWGATREHEESQM